MDIIGQHIARTTVTTTTPHPGCAFYRPNAEKAAEIAVSVLPSATAAQTAGDPAAAAAVANPVDSVGDGGTVAITGDGAVLAVSKGPALVVVRINQRDLAGGYRARQAGRRDAVGPLQARIRPMRG